MKQKLYFILFLVLCQHYFAQSNYFWVGGGGNWNDLNHWRIGSSNGAQATIIPSKYDNVIINNSSGFTALGSGINLISSATCKDFSIDDNFSGKIIFGSGSVFNIYGHVKWRGNVTIQSSVILNLFSDSTNSLPNIIDLPGNLLDSASLNSNSSSSVNFSGTGSFKLMNHFNSNGFFSFNVGGDAILDTNDKNIFIERSISYTSSAISNFGTSHLKANSSYFLPISTFNANANLSQATITAYSLEFPSSQNVKNIFFTKKITVGTLLKAENINSSDGSSLETISGTGSYDIENLNIATTPQGGTIIGGSTPSSNIAMLKVGTMTVGNGLNTFLALQNEISTLVIGNKFNNFYSGKYNINHLTLNGGQIFITPTSTDEFKVNQTLTANPTCNGEIPLLSSGGGKFILPALINGGMPVQFPGYAFKFVNLTGGAAIVAGVDKTGNTGNISFVGISPKTFYRIGGGGNWDDYSKWSFTSGGAIANCLPTSYDDVVFDANSGFVAGNNTFNTINQSVNVRNMTWNNATGNPIFGIDTNIYGSLYLQKDMVASGSFQFLNNNYDGPSTNRYMSFEGQKVNQIYVHEMTKDYFYLVPATWAAPYDVEVIGHFGFSKNPYNNIYDSAPNRLYADGTKIKVGNTFFLGGNSVFINNAIIRTNYLYLSANLPIAAPNTSVYITNEYHGNKKNLTNPNYLFGNIYMEGLAIGKFTAVKSDLFQINMGTVIDITNLSTQSMVVNSGNQLYFSGLSNTIKNLNINTGINFKLISSANVIVSDTFDYNRGNCDAISYFSGSSISKLLLGNNINGNGFVTLNRIMFTDFNVNYMNYIVGVKPINANNSIDGGNNSGITFTNPTTKNFYWKGGSGNWNDINHWSLDASPTRSTSTCGIPSLNDNVFFDEYSGFVAATTNIVLENDIYVNNMTFSGISETKKSTIIDNGMYYSTNINGNLTLYAGFFLNSRELLFINRNYPDGTNKSIYPNGASVNLIFMENANWKVHHGSGTLDMLGIIRQETSAGTLDLSNTVLQLSNFTVKGKEILLNDSDIFSNSINLSPQLPIASTNSVLRLMSNGGTFKTNLLAHSLERVDITGYFNSSYNSEIKIDAPNTIFNRLNILPNFNTNPVTSISFPTVRLVSLKEINHLTIQKSNIIELDKNIKVNQSMLLQGSCLETEQLLIRGNSSSKQILIPNYNATDFKINRVKLEKIAASGGQIYSASDSFDLSGNSGINFISSPARTLYWVGGQGNWNDGNHWSLTSGGAPVANSCDFPTTKDDVIFDQLSGFTALQKMVFVGGIQSSVANHVSFTTDVNSPIINIDVNKPNRELNISGNLSLQNNTSFNSNSYVTLVPGIGLGQTRMIDTKNVNLRLGITAQDYFELQSNFKGLLFATNVKGFKTNNYNLEITNFIYASGFQFNYTQNINPILDFGQSFVNDSSYGFSISSNNLYPVSILAENAKISTFKLEINVPNINNFGEVVITKSGTLNAGLTVHNFNKVTFMGISNTLGASNLVSAGNYKSLYFHPGDYNIASGQNISEKLFMTGTPCNRINISRYANSGQSNIILGASAVYTLFYASIKDINFSTSVSAYGNSQDLGNTTNLNIVPTNVQAVGFGNKMICASDFPKTYDASTFFGTDPNASYTWTKIGSPNTIISTMPTVIFSQPGNYQVNVTYSQDGCNINENFTVTSVTMPVDNTTVSTTSVSQVPMGSVSFSFQGSLNNKSYIFTYNINNGSDMEITSNNNGVATIQHPRNVVGTFIYHLKGIRFANGMACPVVFGNKDIEVKINPDCPTPGVVQMYGNELMGCTATMGAKRLAELTPIIIQSPSIDSNVTKLIPGVGIVVKEGTDVFLLRNNNVSSESLLGLPISKPHVVGAIIYHNDHFYEGVENGKWIRIDND